MDQKNLNTMQYVDIFLDYSVVLAQEPPAHPRKLCHTLFHAI